MSKWLLGFFAVGLLGCASSDDGASTTDAGGVGCGEAKGGLVVSGCAAAVPVTQDQTCRCMLGWYWDGSACVGSAKCRCLDKCDRLFPDQAACETAFSACRPDAARD